MTLHREDDKDYRFAFDCVMRPETAQREVYAQSSELRISRDMQV